MGFFDKLLGRTPQPVGFTKTGWQTGDDTKRAANSWSYLERVGEALRLEQIKIVPQPSATTLHGTLRGFPVEISVSRHGDLADALLRIGDTNQRAIDLENDPTGKLSVGADREEEARFRALPSPLQSRIVDGMRRLRVRYFRSRASQFDIAMLDQPTEVSDPIALLVEPFELAIEMILARGQVPPGKEPERPPTGPAYTKPLAEAIARQVGGTLVERPAHNDIQVRWTEDGVPARLVIDTEYDHLDLEVQADGVLVDITLEYEDEIEIADEIDDDDPWSDSENHLCFSKHMFVSGPRKEVQLHGAFLMALGPLFDELIRTLEKNQLNLFFDDQAITADSFEADKLTDGGANAVAITKLVARVAKACPRGTPPAIDPPVRCGACRALYYRTLARSTCAHCGQR